MRYPGVPAVGQEGSGSFWQLAGTDVEAALVGSADAPRVLGVRGVVMRAEVLRRAGLQAEGIELLNSATEADVSERERYLLALAYGTLRWSIGDGYAGRVAYEQARDLANDACGRLAADLGLLRCRRLNLDRSGLGDAMAYVQEASSLDDSDLLADALREAAAWNVMADELATAADLAAQAAQLHDISGDAYLKGFAEILTARTLNHTGRVSEALELLRAVLDVGHRIRSDDLKMQVRVYLGQFLQRGVGPDSPRWREAQKVLLEALEECIDPWTEAEIRLPLAHLWLAAGMVDDAEEAIDRYEALYLVMGGNLVADANVAKARARIAVARMTAVPYRGFFGSVAARASEIRVLGFFRRADVLYRRAGLFSGAGSIRTEIDLLQALASREVGSPRVDRADRDRLRQARNALLRGIEFTSANQLEEAVLELQRAEDLAASVDAGLLAFAAAGARAETAATRGDRPAARAAIMAALRHSETFRAAVENGSARQNIASSLRAQYERALLIAHDSEAADLVLEIAERLRTERLAGLLQHRATFRLAPEIADLLQEMDQIKETLARRLLARHRPEPAGSALLDASESDLEQRLRGVRERLSRATSAGFADVYDARTDDLATLLTDIDTDVLAIVPVRDRRGEHLVSVWRSLDGRHESVLLSMNSTLEQLRDTLVNQDRSGRLLLCQKNLSPLGPLLPAGLRARLFASREPLPLVIVPAGWLWAVPWAAIPLTQAGQSESAQTEVVETAGVEEALIDRAELTFVPSLRVRAATRARASRPANGVFCFALPGMRSPDLAALDAETSSPRPGPGGPGLKETLLLRPQPWRLAVLATHGNREDGLAQALVDHTDKPLLHAADFLEPGAQTPQSLVLAACHGLYPPNNDPHEPLGLTVCALLSGAREVLASHLEADFGMPIASGVLGATYLAVQHGGSAAPALAAAQRQVKSKSREPLTRWATFAIVGSGQ